MEPGDGAVDGTVIRYDDHAEFQVERRGIAKT